MLLLLLPSYFELSWFSPLFAVCVRFLFIRTALSALAFDTFVWLFLFHSHYLCRSRYPWKLLAIVTKKENVTCCFTFRSQFPSCGAVPFSRMCCLVCMGCLIEYRLLSAHFTLVGHMNQLLFGGLGPLLHSMCVYGCVCTFVCPCAWLFVARIRKLFTDPFRYVWCVFHCCVSYQFGLSL